VKDVSKRIKDLRQEKGMTQEELAERLHVTRQAVSNWETKKTRPDVEMLEEISAVFGVTLMEFLYGKEKPPIERRKLIPVAVFGTMTVLSVALRIFAVPIVVALASRTYDMRGAILLEGTIRLLYAAAVPLALSVISLWLNVAVKNAAARKVLLVLGLVPVAMVVAMVVMASVFSGQIGVGVPDKWAAVYMGLFAVSMSKYTPLITGALLYLGIKKPNKKGEDL